jgi:hypothetical protein
MLDCGPRVELWRGNGEVTMARRNLTVQLDEEVIRGAKTVAAKRGTSVSGLVARELEELVAEDGRYEDARRRADQIMATSVPRGGRHWRRDDLHER